ncbi:MAG: amidohydrolase family protein [Chthonomonadales bacterium]
MPVFDIHTFMGGSVVPGVSANAGAVLTEAASRSVDAVVLMSAHARRVDPIAGNRVLARMIEQAPHLYGCMLANTSRVEASTAVMRELMPQRKFVAMAIVSGRWNDPVRRLVADDLINSYRRYSKPLFLFTPTGEAVAAALEIARAYPMLKMVLLGMGGADWRAAVAAAHQCTNILLETSGALDRAKIPAAVAALGAHRILFGSGSPHLDPVAAVGLLDDSDLSEDVRRKILYDNAARLFGITQASKAEE